MPRRHSPPPPSDFDHTWENRPGFVGWLAVVNNQPVGKRFLVTSFVFFLLGGVLALLMRTQLAVSENGILGPQLYNELFTMHGSTMMFLFAVPFVEGLAVYLLPLQIGARDLAFPRLSAFGYWCFLFGGILFYATFFVNLIPDAGWFAYTPLSGTRYSGRGLDFWLLALGLVEVGGITAGIEIVVTILKFRAPGMALHRMPLFAWTMLVTGLMIVFAFTTLLVATLLLELERAFGMPFFDPQGGGSSLLWQHLFWFFGHPEVYIMFLPATGVVSMIVPTFARRPLAGYLWVVMAVVVTGFVSFGLWVHHMFAAGLPKLSLLFFSGASLMIALASGAQVFAWIATLWGRRPALKTPLLYVLGFLFLFVAGGVTGVMVAVVPFDLQVHDTFFVVAHFHYVIIGGVLFPLLGGISYWYPKFTGRLLSEGAGRIAFGLIFIGFNVAFFPMHIMGLYGMPRRVYSYPASLNVDGYNLVSTGGAYLMALGVLVFVVNLLRSMRAGEPAGSDPWGGGSLEWTLPSPPAIFAWERPPRVGGRHPAWEGNVEEPGASRQAREALDRAPVGWRATLATDVLTGEPESVQWLPSSTLQPLTAALALLLVFFGVLVKIYLLTVAGLIGLFAAVIAWLLPHPATLAKIQAGGTALAAGLPLVARRGTGWWGMIGALTTLGMGFGVLVFSYFYLRIYSAAWPQGGLPLPGLLLPAAAYLLMPIGAVAMRAAARRMQPNASQSPLAPLAMALAAGGGFLIFHGILLWQTPFLPGANAYAAAWYAPSTAYLLLALVATIWTLGVLRLTRRAALARTPMLENATRLGFLLWGFTAALGVTLYLALHVGAYV